MSSDTNRTDKITHYLYWPTFIKILLTILYYDYKCLCFINLLAGNYGIYGALRQSIMEKKWSIMKKWCQTLARSLEFCFFRFWLSTTHPGHLPNWPLHMMTYRNLVYFTHHDFRKIPCFLFLEKITIFSQKRKKQNSSERAKVWHHFFIMDHFFSIMLCLNAP
jgi:hypothetical protein